MPIRFAGSRAWDDRGREVVLGGLSPSVVDGLRDQSLDPALHDLRLRVHAVVRRGGFSIREFLLPAVISALVLGWITFRTRSTAPLAFVEVIAAFMGLAAIIAAFCRIDRRLYRTSPNLIVRAFLAEGRCPACGYILDGVPETIAGDVQCPECQAAWKPSRIGRPQGAVALLRQSPWTIGRIWNRLLNSTSRPGGRIVLDARGRVARMPDPLLLRVDVVRVAALSADRASLIRNDVRRQARGRIWTRLIVYALLLFAPLLLRISGVAPAPPGAPIGLLPVQLGLLLLMACIMVAIAYQFIRGDWAIEAEKAAGVFAEHALCPVCLGPLDEPTQDRTAACNACGGWWRRAGDGASANPD